VRFMETFEVVVEPASPRSTAMLLGAFKTEGVTVVRAPEPPEERRDAMGAMALAVSSAMFVLQAADSESVRRAIDKVNQRLSQMLNTRVTPRHKR